MSEKSDRAWRPDQAWLSPPSPQDWLPESHLVYFLTDAVRDLDIGASYDRMQTAEVRLQNEIRELPARAEAEDQAEDAGTERTGAATSRRTNGLVASRA